MPGSDRDLLEKIRLGEDSYLRLIRFEKQAVGGTTLGDLSEPLWRRFQTGRSRDETAEAFLNKLGMLRRDDSGAWRATVAGVLLASPDPRRWLPNAFIQAVAYWGRTAAEKAPGGYYQLDAADLTGPLDQQVAEACRFVARNKKTQARKVVGRQDFPQFSITAVFEAVVNAVAHRDYSIHGSKIRLRIFSDRLELYSPGALVNTMTVESLRLRQAARNEAITSLLAKCRIPDNLPGLETDRTTLMDRRGEGVPLVLDASEELSGRSPEYRTLDDAELMLTIWAADPLGEAIEQRLSEERAEAS